MAFAIALFVLIAGSVLFHILSPWYLTPLASNWDMVDFTIDVTFWVTGIVFVAVNSFMAYCIIKFRYRKDRRSEYQPENHKLELWLTGITSVGVAAMLGPGLWVWAEFVTVPDNADEIEAIGQQWHWSFRLPGDDGKFGAVDASLITDANPFGMDPEDPQGLDDRLIESNRLHLPIGRPVKINLRSKDVLHNFTVPQFRVKMDLVPGLVSYLWLTPIRIGEFEILCEELCGIGHFAMRGAVIVDSQEDYDLWHAAQPTYAEIAARPQGDPVAGAGLYALCAACHGPQGEGSAVLNSPKVAGMGSWYLERQLAYYKSGARGTHPEDIYGRQMAPMMATLAGPQAIADVAAYIGTFPDVPAEPTISGDAERGERFWITCGACHGAAGQGIKALNAPRLAGMTDWYMARQLEHFKSGVRGHQPGDLYGSQMAVMAAILKDDDAINDVLAYINTLDAAEAPALLARGGGHGGHEGHGMHEGHNMHAGQAGHEVHEGQDDHASQDGHAGHALAGEEHAANLGAEE